jgi:hypothetical protein
VRTVAAETPEGESVRVETKSVYEGFVYGPRREATRKGAHERTTGHQWRCLKCKSIVHTETLIGFDHEETHAEASARHLRINEALTAHRAAHEEETERCRRQSGE